MVGLAFSVAFGQCYHVACMGGSVDKYGRKVMIIRSGIGIAISNFGLALPLQPGR